jgi:hypothetical protein
MVAAYEGAMRELNFSGPEDPGAETLAKTIVALCEARASAIQYVSNNVRGSIRHTAGRGERLGLLGCLPLLLR